MENCPQSDGLRNLSDEEVLLPSKAENIAAYELEKLLAPTRDPAGLEDAVRIRRALLPRASLTRTLETSAVLFQNYGCGKAHGACCEDVVGYVPLPLGIAGPLTIDGIAFHLPMATAEVTRVANTFRDCNALNAGGGVTTFLTQDAMTRG